MGRPRKEVDVISEDVQGEKVSDDLELEFKPTFVYRKPGIHQCRGGTYDIKLASSLSDLQALTEIGWSAEHPEK